MSSPRITIEVLSKLGIDDVDFFVVALSNICSLDIDEPSVVSKFVETVVDGNSDSDTELVIEAFVSDGMDRVLMIDIKSLYFEELSDSLMLV